MHKFTKYILTLASALMIGCGAYSHASLGSDTETSVVECLASDFEVSANSIRNALEYNVTYPISIKSDLKCSVRLGENEKRAKQYFIKKEILGVRVLAAEGFHGLDISVMSREYREELKAIHLLYMARGTPKRVFSYYGTEGSSHWVQTRLFNNRDYFLCERKTDYILVLEWLDSSKGPALARKLSVKNAPIACERDV